MTQVNGVMPLSTDVSITKGYKVTNPNMTCLSFQFELGVEYTQPGKLELCEKGFHFCQKVADCFNYYGFDSKNRVFEIEAYGEVQTSEDKSCTLRIKLVKELSWSEMLVIANEGKDNTGLRNTGDWNTGNWNTGDWNTGDRNTGYRNTGDRNTGYTNTGNWNTGDWNTGYSNTGYSNTGNWNTGDWNTGDLNTGYRNTGYSNTGNSNTGYRNTGNSNTGYRNTGDRNTGYTNTGNSNTGNWNTGDWNTGDRNTGYSNTGDRNSGAFCTVDAPFTLFNKPCSMTESEFLESDAFYLMRNYVNTKMWVSDSAMTDEEKAANQGWKTLEGYFKDIPFKEAFTNAWHNWSETNRAAFTSLENFDPIAFEEITGVKVQTTSNE